MSDTSFPTSSSHTHPAPTSEHGAEYERGRDAMLALLTYYKANQAHRNEATTRMQLIDRLLFDCLSWDREDCELESTHGDTYADYILKCPQPYVVVEAKREGLYFEIPAAKKTRFYTIKRLLQDVPKLGPAIQQTAQYCQRRGISIGVVSNGHQLVAFIGAREDGIPPDHGKAMVFESMTAVAEDFLTLWQCLSKPGVQQRRLHRHLLGAALPVLPPKMSETLAVYPGMKARNSLQADLQNLSELLLEDVTRAPELEETFLRECYCDNNALSQYALISKKLLQARYDAIFERPDSGLIFTHISVYRASWSARAE